MRPKAKATWLTIGAIVVAHNISAADGDTLSEAVDAWIVSHPWLTRAVIAVLAMHLANVMSRRVDPVHLVFIGVRAVPHHHPHPRPQPRDVVCEDPDDLRYWIEHH